MGNGGCVVASVDGLGVAGVDGLGAVGVGGSVDFLVGGHVDSACSRFWAPKGDGGGWCDVGISESVSGIGRSGVIVEGLHLSIGFYSL